MTLVCSRFRFVQEGFWISLNLESPFSGQLNRVVKAHFDYQFVQANAMNGFWRTGFGLS